MRMNVLLLAVVVLGACSGNSGPPGVVDQDGRHDGAAPKVGKKVEVSFEDAVELIGVELPKKVKAGANGEAKLLWRVKKALKGELRPYLHLTASGKPNQIVAMNKHKFANGAVPPSDWRINDVIVDEFTFPIPAKVTETSVDVRVGVLEFTGEGDKRRMWEITTPKADDGQDRFLAGKIAVDVDPKLKAEADAKAAAAAVPTAELAKRTAKIKLDGVLDDAEWKDATVLELKNVEGAQPVTHPTRVRALWDEEALYFAFEVEDPDVLDVHGKQDDPLDESEALEVLLATKGRSFVELAANAADTHYDAFFTDGGVKGDATWNSKLETKAKKNAKGYASEWKIPVASLKDVPAGEPKAGAQWKLNVARIERLREGAGNAAKIVGLEESAWAGMPRKDGSFGVVTFK